RADVMVIGAIPLAGHESEISPLSRSTIVGRTHYDTYTYGWWLDHPSSAYSVLVNGIALGLDSGRQLLALSADPALDAQLVGTTSAESSASIVGGPPLVGYDNYTTGRKRFLIMRPGFSDVTNTMTDAQVPGHFSSFSNNMYEMSSGKLSFAGLGQGSDVTPIMKLPG